MATTSEAVDLYLASLRARHVPMNTIKAYTHDLRHFVAAVPADLAQVTAPLIQRFLEGDGHHSRQHRGGATRPCVRSIIGRCGKNW